MESRRTLPAGGCAGLFCKLIPVGVMLLRMPFGWRLCEQFDAAALLTNQSACRTIQPIHVHESHATCVHEHLSSIELIMPADWADQRNVSHTKSSRWCYD